jgi:thymidylate kinase
VNEGFITFHGIDGTGKTSVVAGLVERLAGGGVPSFNARDCSINSENNSTESNIHPDILRKILQSQAIRSEINAGRIALRDRWLIDTYADKTHAGIVLPTPPEEILVPDLSVILRCNDKIRLRRTSLRENPTEDDLVLNSVGTRAYYFENYLLNNIGRFASRSLVIDTTYNSPEETVSEIMEQVWPGA